MYTVHTGKLDTEKISMLEECLRKCEDLGGRKIYEKNNI